MQRSAILDYDAVIFDLNGTLVHDDHFHVAAWKEMCREHFREISDDDYRQYFASRKNEEIFQSKEIFGTLSTAEIQHYSDTKERLYCKMTKGILNEVEGFSDFSDFLREHRIQQAVATNAPKLLRDFILEELGLSSRFEVVIGPEEVVLGKPHPEMFLKTADALRVDPTRCVVFEDSIVGVRAGKAAGMRVVGVMTTKSAEDLKEADDLILDFMEIH